MTAKTKTAPKTKKAPAKSGVEAYVRALQHQVNTDIQSVKSGAMDEELLRSKMVAEMDPASPSTELTLWLHALAGGLIDNLSVVVSAGENGPKMDYFPEWNRKDSDTTPILELPIPGPLHSEKPAGAGNPALESASPDPAAPAAQQA